VIYNRAAPTRGAGPILRASPSHSERERHRSRISNEEEIAGRNTDETIAEPIRKIFAERNGGPCHEPDNPRGQCEPDSLCPALIRAAAEIRSPSLTKATGSKTINRRQNQAAVRLGLAVLGLLRARSQRREQSVFPKFPSDRGT